MKAFKGGFLAVLLLTLLVGVAVYAQSPCGDGTCDQAEQANPNLCPQDCPVTTEAVGQTPQPNQGQGQPNQNPCGDGVCGPVEQSNPNACPQDCANVTPQAGGQGQPNQNPCGDGVCDDFEKNNPSACQVDCQGGQNTTQGGQPQQGQQPNQMTREQERAMYDPDGAITTLEKWVVIGQATNQPMYFAPSVVLLPDDSYRMYHNGDDGVLSSVSSDGINWTVEEGVRLENGGEGAIDCRASHAWVIPVAEGYRMYYQADATCKFDFERTGPPEFVIMSAFSADGVTFEREGVRVQTGEETDLQLAAHGRTLVLPDGYRMYFSANLLSRRTPASILGATSVDGLTWELDADLLVEGGHDPTVILLEDTVHLYTTFMRDNFLHLTSTDGGYTFEPAAWVEFYQADGTRLEEFGDADIIQMPDGRVLMYGSGKGVQGVLIMEQATE